MSLSPKVKATLQALLVTFLWSSSYILTKFGLVDVQPLTLVGLRYLVASLVLLPIALLKGEHRKVSRKTLLRLGALGILGYMVAQGFQCLGLYYLPSITVTLILNFTPVLVILLNLILKGESPNKSQIIGLCLIMLGAFLFFVDEISGNSLTGFVFTIMSGVGWAGYLVLSKIFFKSMPVSPLGNTAFAMSIGTAFLSISAFSLEGLEPITASGWLIIFWLGVVNTSLAFFLWNDALQKLGAFEISVLQNTMLIQITLLSIIFLSESLPIAKYFYMLLVFVGVYTVQFRTNK